jgi:hypothetical protein
MHASRRPWPRARLAGKRHHRASSHGPDAGLGSARDRRAAQPLPSDLGFAGVLSAARDRSSPLRPRLRCGELEPDAVELEREPHPPWRGGLPSRSWCEGRARRRARDSGGQGRRAAVRSKGRGIPAVRGGGRAAVWWDRWSRDQGRRAAVRWDGWSCGREKDRAGAG